MKTDSKYLNKIHNKINIRKIRNNIIGVISSISICLFIVIYQPTKEDLLFESLFSSLTYYEWEYDYEISNDDILYYLIDTTCIEDYDNVLNNELIEIVDKINLGS
tara:strand:- start:276 stop:590 length:315 start_codon:yes stop_codon:yes gene_type:complete